ncbi:ribosome small subunit-dependent GTPase A [Gammaproteobacteria bacterium]|nr:ribosome small subunit-dependent GTPase A [Gammaproteobacteria bacterium]
MKNKKLFKAKQDKSSEKLTGTERIGTIIAHYGAVVDVESDSGEIYHANLKRNFDPCITGDKVLFRSEQNDTNIIVKILPRKSLLKKTENKYKIKLIAANIDKMIVVSAPQPLFSTILIDRYIVCAELLDIKPVLVFNKTDLLDIVELNKIKNQLSIYQQIGYSIIFSNITSTDGLINFKSELTDNASILVGMSGVGKSSLVSALVGDESIKTGSVGAFGRHTTTSTRLYHLPSGGDLIDSPGVREFVISNLQSKDVIFGFLDFKSYIGNCKFRNCQHNNESNCALLQAVSKGEISPARWNSYLNILAEIAEK